VGTLLGAGFFVVGARIGQVLLTYLISILSLGFGVYLLFTRPKKNGVKLVLFGVYGALHTLIEYVAQPLMRAANAIPEGTWKNAATQFPDYIQVLFKLPHAILGCVLIILIVTIALQEKTSFRRVLIPLFLGGSFALIFGGKPMALVGTPYIILAAFAVRSLPASVRSGVASLQQIDPSIEEASAIMGADAQYTFRKVTLPLIMPAILAGLIFSFTRHMTSLSAIIFLVSAKWRIVTASILSEWEQGGISMAAAYSTIIIVFVLIAIGILYLVSGKMLKRRGGIDITWGA